MDLATLLGIIIGFVMVVIGIITSTTNPTLKGIMDTFVDIPSIAVTIGGSMAGMLTSYTFKTFLGHLKGFGIAMKDPKLDNGQVISKIIELSNTARKEGLLALEEVAQGLAFGLNHANGSPKQSYNVYKYIDTPNHAQYTDFAKSIIGISSWSEIMR